MNLEARCELYNNVTDLEVTTRSKVIYLTEENGEEIYFEEKDVWDKIELNGILHAVDCNYGHMENDFKLENAPKTSTRGRKPIDRSQKKSRKDRKKIGDGSSFNTQLQITAFGEYERPAGYVGRKKEVVTADPDNPRIVRVEKEYPVKLFRNGKMVIVGCMTDDLSDISLLLAEIANAMSKVLERPLRTTRVVESMRNYKFMLLGGTIDMNALYKYFKKIMEGDMIGINREFFLRYASRPMYVPGFETWEKDSQILLKRNVNRLFSNAIIGNKNTYKDQYLTKERFEEMLEFLNLENEYRTMVRIINVLGDLCYPLPEEVYVQLMLHRMEKKWEQLCKKWPTQSWITYDVEVYSGMLVRVKTPVTSSEPDVVDDSKITTVKIFGSGKINVDGCAEGSRETVHRIHAGVSKILHDSGAVYYTLYKYHEKDEEFPE